MALSVPLKMKFMQTKRVIENLKRDAKDVIQNKNHSNKIIDILESFLAEDEEVVIAAINCVERIFSHFIQTKSMFLDQPPILNGKCDAIDRSTEEKYKIWLLERYTDSLEQLYNCLESSNENVKKASLCALMKLLSKEGTYPLIPSKDGVTSFPCEKLKAILSKLLSADREMREIIARFQEFLEYDDVKYYTLKMLLVLVKNVKPEDASVAFVRNLFFILSQISFPQKSKDGKVEETSNAICKSEADSSNFRLNYMAASKVFSSLWIQFLKFRLPSTLYLKVLIKIPDEVMPHMQNPLLLTDFLTESYNIGGSASLIALQGLFVLMQKCNLEYPDFYKKLYALFEPSVLYVKYRPRFFFWADIFLTSTHLPAYLVAAFVKRLARLALSAPPHVLLMIIPFVRNLFVRHPSLKILIHRPNSGTLENDPYLMDEPDPANCKALESSLWEIKTLQSHWYHKVATAAKFIDSPLPQMETDLADVLEGSISELMSKEVRKKHKTAPLSLNKPTGLFSSKEDLTGSCWAIK